MLVNGCNFAQLTARMFGPTACAVFR